MWGGGGGGVSTASYLSTNHTRFSNGYLIMYVNAFQVYLSINSGLCS